ncbi:CALL4 protein, partial [Irena cyanogastra]|nr:CALL4 protein [Irena cyanogastra]
RGVFNPGPSPSRSRSPGPALPAADRSAELDFSTFLNIMYRQMKQEEPEEEILRALAMIDRQKRGEIAVPELRAKLTRLGEKLSEEEGARQRPQGPNLSFSSLPFSSLLFPSLPF